MSLLFGEDYAKKVEEFENKLLDFQKENNIDLHGKVFIVPEGDKVKININEALPKDLQLEILVIYQSVWG